ncbi:MAG: TolC family protein [Chitinophagaceae bacterium]
MKRSMKKIATTLLFAGMAGVTWAQTNTILTLDEAYQWAQQNYPMIRQKDLVKQTASYTISNLNKGFLPQVTVTGKATYQSDVTEIPVQLPGLTIEQLAKDQYQVLAEVSQLVYDGGATAAQRNLQQVNALVEGQKAEVELYKVKERINQLYLGVLLLDEQLKQVELVKKDIRLGIQRVAAQVNNGTAFRSNQLTLEAELLKNDQRTIELKAGRKAYVEVLALFINKPLPEDVQLKAPVMTTVAYDREVIRPELRLFSYQDSLFNTQQSVISAKNRPKLSLFAQGGYGRPGLNMLDNSFNFYYIAGARLNWSLGSLYTTKKERQLLEVNQKMIAVQKDVFMLNTNTQLKQQEEDIAKLRQLMEVDDQIISIRAKVKEASNAQLENGVITANDFLKEVNAEDQARLSLIAHQVQLLQAQINYQTLTGKQ